MMSLRAGVLAMMIALSGCALSDVFSMLKPSSGINTDIEVVAGDKAIHTEVAGTKETTTNTADAITQTYTTMNEQAPWWVMILLVLGWVMPAPSQMWNGIKGLIWRKK